MMDKSQNVEFYNFYSSPNIIRMINSRRMRWAGRVTDMGEMRNAYKILVGKPEGTTPLVTPRRRWEDNIKMDRIEIWWESVNWIHMAQDKDL
jgi:hypothetical protein